VEDEEVVVMSPVELVVELAGLFDEVLVVEPVIELVVELADTLAGAEVDLEVLSNVS